MRLDPSTRVLVGVREVANFVREVADALGGACRVDTVAIVNRFYPGNRYTHELRPASRLALRWRLFCLFFRVARRYDLFVFISGLSFFPLHLDLLLLRLLGKHIVMLSMGDDVRFRPIHCRLEQALLGRQMLPPVPQLSTLRHFLRTLLAQKVAEGVCDRALSLRNQATFQSHPFFFLRFPTRVLRAAAKAAAPHPLIVHAPSDPASKGTAMVTEAMRALAAKGLEFRFELITDRDNAYVLERLQQADILIDQPATWVARLAAEGLASSCVVLGGNNPEYEGAPAGERSPVQPFEPDAAALARRLEALLTDAPLRTRLMAESFEYWRRAYSPEAFARYFADVIAGSAPMVPPRPRHKAMLLEAAGNAFQRTLIRAMVREA